MMKALIIFFLMSFSLMAGTSVGNGSLKSQQRVIESYRRLSEWIYIALRVDLKLSDVEKELLTKVYLSLIDEYKNSRQLIFLRENEIPGFFKPGEQAKTGDNIGDEIYFNLDRLYIGQTEAFSLSMCFALLIHELSHHQGKQYSHEVIYSLSSKVGVLLEKHTTQLMLYNNPSIIATLWSAYAWDETNTTYFNDQLYVESASQSFSLNDEVFKSLNCENFGYQENFKSFHFWQIYWKRFSNNLTQFNLKLDFFLLCKDKNNQLKEIPFSAEWDVTLELIKPNPRIASLVFRQMSTNTNLRSGRSL